MPRGAPLLAVALFVALAGAWLSGCSDSDRTLRVFAAASLTDAFTEAGQRFEAEHPEVSVAFSFGGSQRLRLQLEQGARADLFAAANALEIEAAASADLLSSGPAGFPVVFASNALALVVPPANPAAITRIDDLASGGVRLTVAGPAVPAGRLTRLVLEALGLTDAVLGAVVSEEENVRAVLTKVAIGEADAGFVYASDVASAGDDVLRIPLAETGLRNDYLIAVTVHASDAELARQFIDFLRSDAGQRLLRDAGFESPAAAAAREDDP